MSQLRGPHPLGKMGRHSGKAQVLPDGAGPRCLHTSSGLGPLLCDKQRSLGISTLAAANLGMWKLTARTVILSHRPCIQK